MRLLGENTKCRLISFLAWLFVSIIGLTTRKKVVGFEHVQRLIESGQGFIMAVWHGRTLLPIYHCRGMGIWAITSLSRDGEIQTGVVSRFGYKTIRGSSGRGAVKAALAACKKLEDGEILAITPDGPRGPRRQVQEGIIFMAQRSGCPIIPIGAAARRRKLLPTWDKYAIPLPFSKCAIVYSEPITFGEGATLEAAEEPELMLKRILDDVQRQAEEMVGEEKSD
ncbi:MAG: lysophospholipid acyltransferase family protein [Armatimonadota bacterium]|nr:lysophospholipid acyltransferase family protein [Armatimonadota bacterium]